MVVSRGNGNSVEFFSKADGAILLRLARQAISENFPLCNYSDPELAPLLKDEVFQSVRSSFVTLKINGKLRGCIGSIGSSDPVITGIRENAIGAAFHDSRFPPVTISELDQLDIEISILTEPAPLEYADYHDLLALLRPCIDGLIIRKGMMGATFLPQVWDQLPAPEDFLSHLCMKAGIGGDAWKSEKLEIQTYRVQHFEEERPV